MSAPWSQTTGSRNDEARGVNPGTRVIDNCYTPTVDPAATPSRRGLTESPIMAYPTAAGNPARGSARRPARGACPSPDTPGRPSPPGDPGEWKAIEAEILAKLDIAAEYRAMGVVFVRDTPTHKGWQDCHAIDRK